MRYLLGLVCLLVSTSWAQPLPNDAARLLPLLKQEVAAYWPTVTPVTWIPALIEQESLWKAKATLKTSREHGCGLGQFTKAYREDGSVRFDALEETRALDPSLATWGWRDCANVQFQLRGAILKLKVNDRACHPLMFNERESRACSGAMYNGGSGSVFRRIRTCGLDGNCDPTRWFGHLELKAPQSTTRHKGYGESFAEINSKYPARVEARQPKYVEPMK